MRKVLIIRSISFQQLDKNLPLIQQFFADSELSILTHEHGVGMAKKYADISNVFPYPFKGGFSYFRRAGLPADERFDDIVIPVGNLTGLGFFNVLLFSLSIKARKRWVCNLVSEIREIGTGEIIWMGAKNLAFKGAALVCAGIGSVLLGLLMPVLLLLIRNKGGDKA